MFGSDSRDDDIMYTTSVIRDRVRMMEWSFLQNCIPNSITNKHQSSITCYSRDDYNK